MVETEYDFCDDVVVPTTGTEDCNLPNREGTEEGKEDDERTSSATTQEDETPVIELLGKSLDCTSTRHVVSNKPPTNSSTDKHTIKKTKKGGDPTQASVYDAARKAGTAVVGGTMVSLGVGLVIIPLPISIPAGLVVAGAGMSVLGREFPAAERVLVKTKGALVDVIERNIEEEEEKEEEKDGEDTKEDDDDIDECNELGDSATTPAPRSDKSGSSELDDARMVRSTTRRQVQRRGESVDYSGYTDATKYLKRQASRAGRAVLPVIKSIPVSSSESARQADAADDHDCEGCGANASKEESKSSSDGARRGEKEKKEYEYPYLYKY